MLLSKALNECKDYDFVHQFVLYCNVILYVHLYHSKMQDVIMAFYYMCTVLSGYHEICGEIYGCHETVNPSNTSLLQSHSGK